MDMDKHSETILNNFLNSIRQNTIDIDPPCENYQKGKTIFNEQGSSFLAPRVCCPALPALGKTSSDSTSTSPAAGVHDIEDSIKLTEMSVIKTDTDIERDIQPLVAAINRIDEFCTVFSCHGHRFSSLPMRPFVRFFSKKVKTVLDFADIIYSLNLNYKWIVAGLAVNLCPLHHPYIMWDLKTKNFLFSRKKLRKDIACIFYNISNQKGLVRLLPPKK
jgi:hypothetical protein